MDKGWAAVKGAGSESETVELARWRGVVPPWLHRLKRRHTNSIYNIIVLGQTGQICAEWSWPSWQATAAATAPATAATAAPGSEPCRYRNGPWLHTGTQNGPSILWKYLLRICKDPRAVEMCRNFAFSVAECWVDQGKWELLSCWLLEVSVQQPKPQFPKRTLWRQRSDLSGSVSSTVSSIFFHILFYSCMFKKSDTELKEVRKVAWHSAAAPPQVKAMKNPFPKFSIKLSTTFLSLPNMLVSVLFLHMIEHICK